MKSNRLINSKTLILLWGILLIGLTGAGHAIAQQLYYNGSMQFATGSYFFEENTRSYYLINGLSIQNARFNASFNFPFVIQSSPWISYSETGGIPTGGPQHGMLNQNSGQGMRGKRQRLDLPDTSSFVQSGFSDPSLSFGYKLLGSDYGATALHINTSVKFPFADPAKGFGTGAWDMGVGSSLSHRLDTWFITVNVTYWHFGDMSDLELKNALNYGAGVGKSLSGGDWMILGSFNGMTTIIEGIDPPRSAGMGLGYQVGTRTNLNVNAYFGLSESSSDVAIGGGWQVTLN